MGVEDLERSTGLQPRQPETRGCELWREVEVAGLVSFGDLQRRLC